MNEYDNLFIYVQNFEEWIEKEQLNRHEYKNQLAVLYSLSKELKVKNKIQDILKDNLNIENPIENKLKVLPKGGIKGLMYYKSIIAQNNKLNLTIDISIDPKGILNKLNNEERNKICKLIGIYYDNAIEAAKESRKKNILIEIYELSNKVNIVFSNTFKKTSLITNKELKGVSTKGKGRGNGLFFAKKIINNNNFLYEKSEIIDHYYIETLTIIK
jgi:two-component system sensor histidine kinase AgrC